MVYALQGDGNSAEGGGAIDAITTALKLGQGLERLDPSLKELVERLASLDLELRDIARDFERNTDGIESDPARVASLEERMAQLEKLRRKYGSTVEEILAFRADAAEQLAGIEGVVPGLLGQSLVPLLHAGESDWATVPAPSELRLGILRLQSLRTRKWKIIRDEQRDVNMFFDLEHDPAEQFPRAPSAEDPRSTTALRELKMYFDAYAATRRKVGGEASECPVEDPDLLERLRSLGYVD